MGRKWWWCLCMLLVVLLLFISLEAAIADDKGGQGGNGKVGGGNNNDGGDHGNDNGKGDGGGNKGGDPGNGKGDDRGNKDDGHNKQPPPPPPRWPPIYPPPSLPPPSSPPPPPSSSPPPPSPPPSIPVLSPPPPPLSSPPPPSPPPSIPVLSPPPPPLSSPPPPSPPPSIPVLSPPPPPLSSPPPPSPPPSIPVLSPPPSPLSSPPPLSPPPSIPVLSPPPPPLSSPPPLSPPPSIPVLSPPPPPSPPSQSPPTSSPPPKDDSTDYYLLSPMERTGQEQAVCKDLIVCPKLLTCPDECPHRKPSDNKTKGCFFDCSSKCEATCKWRKPNCDGFGSLCYDPRFVGGDGKMFYFHGSKGSHFAIVSDDNLHINAHFIGTRPMGRTRDFTWVQAFSIMFDTHTLVLAAKRVSKWDDKVESLIVKWNNEMINIPRDGEAEWRIKTDNRAVVIERTDDFNTVRVTVSGLVQLDLRVVPIGKKENKVHNYQIPSDDAFAHLETQFKFFKLSDTVEGVLGKTYQPGYESPVKTGVAMPLMGGEDKYQTPSLNSPLCKLCKFQRPSNSIAMVTAI